MKKSHLWKVVYDTVFNSSSGMEKYSIPDQNLECYVVTEKASLDSVLSELDESLATGVRVTKICSANWLGEIINPI